MVVLASGWFTNAKASPFFSQVLMENSNFKSARETWSWTRNFDWLRSNQTKRDLLILGQWSLTWIRFSYTSFQISQFTNNSRTLHIYLLWQLLLSRVSRKQLMIYIPAHQSAAHSNEDLFKLPRSVFSFCGDSQTFLYAKGDIFRASNRISNDWISPW